MHAEGVREMQMQRATNTATVSANTLECALEMSKKTWLLAIQFPDREQPSVYTIKGGDAAALLAKLIAARDRWAEVRRCAPSLTVTARARPYCRAAGTREWAPPGPNKRIRVEAK